jgi:acetoin utilization deacetylase AcuC-like enzyme
MRTSREGFGGLAATLLAAAGTSAQDRIAFFLEGGYDLTSLKDGVKEVLLRMAGEIRTPVSPASLTEASKLEIEPMVQVVRKYWKL